MPVGGCRCSKGVSPICFLHQLFPSLLPQTPIPFSVRSQVSNDEEERQIRWMTRGYEEGWPRREREKDLHTPNSHGDRKRPSDSRPYGIIFRSHVSHHSGEVWVGVDQGVVGAGQECLGRHDTWCLMQDWEEVRAVQSVVDLGAPSHAEHIQAVSTFNL